MAISIPDIPEDAPFSAEQRLWLKSYLSELVRSFAAAGASALSATAGKPRALFLFGSQSGNAQSLCEGFAEIMNQDGWGAEVVDMEKYATVDLTEEPLDEPPRRFQAAASRRALDGVAAWTMQIGETRRW